MPPDRGFSYAGFAPAGSITASGAGPGVSLVVKAVVPIPFARRAIALGATFIARSAVVARIAPPPPVRLIHIRRDFRTDLRWRLSGRWWCCPRISRSQSALAVQISGKIGAVILAGVLHAPGTGLPRQFGCFLPVPALAFGIGGALAVIGLANPAHFPEYLNALLRAVIGRLDGDRRGKTAGGSIIAKAAAAGIIGNHCRIVARIAGVGKPNPAGIDAARPGIAGFTTAQFEMGRPAMILRDPS